MAKNEIVAGNFEGCKLIVASNKVMLIRSLFKSYDITSKIVSVELVTNENKKKFLGTAGGALLGGALLGGVGLVAGALVSGNKKEMIVACELTTGQKFLASVDQKLYRAMFSASVTKKQ